MTLTIPTRIGPYEVVSKLGEGGMGEVYRATDTHLKRQVAIKVLPASVAADPDRLARFQREAEVLAALNHPHIAAIYGLEKTPECTALVMELVDGDDLSERIARLRAPGALAVQAGIPLDEALAIAKQIAEALEAAHEQGIIHRDLKPANIKVRADGTVKVLDFGLAKAVEQGSGIRDQGSGSPSISPTLTSPALMTGMGVILGTAAYMAPEQASGRAVDKRADIWAFGVVLWEMLTGRRLFEAETVSHTLADVLRAPIDLAALPTSTPRAIRELVGRCLVRDPRRRLRDIGDARVAIEEQLAHPEDQAVPPATDASSTASQRPVLVMGALVALLTVALATLGWLHWRTPSVGPSRTLHVSVSAPDNARVGFFALSPDAKSVVLTYGGTVAVRSIDTGELRVLKGVENVRAPFWSPDSRSIGFFSVAERTLQTVSASGGPLRTLCRDVAGNGGGTWNQDGTILFSTGLKLVRTSASGGPCTDVPAGSDTGRNFPVFLPDGNHYLYLAENADEEKSGVNVASLQDASGRRLIADRSSALFLPDGLGATRGRLLFARDQMLMAQPFDASSQEMLGEPVAVASHVSYTLNQPQTAASAAADGTLVYLANSQVERQMVWVDRSGTEVRRAAATGLSPASLSLSPDGKRVVFSRRDPQGRFSVWLQDAAGGPESRFTDPAPQSIVAAWSPDGQHLAFVAGRTPQERGIYVKALSGGAAQQWLALERVPSGPSGGSVSQWSPDGKWIVYNATGSSSGPDIWLLPTAGAANGPGTPIPLVHTAAIESQGQVSPDGRRLAYVSNESGSFQVYVTALGDGQVSDRKWQVSRSATSGREPRWRADGRELFYIEPVQMGGEATRVMSVEVGTAPDAFGAPKMLFEFRTSPYVTQQNIFAYAVAPDGQHFLTDSFASGAQPSLEMILNVPVAR